MKNRSSKKRSYLLVLLLIIANILFFSITTDIPLKELKEKYANEESQFIEIDGMQVHYRDEGEGMPIVLIHGTGASLHTWDDWTAILKKDFRVIRLDLPAFGLTGPHPSHDYRIETYADFLDKFLIELDIDSLYLAGNSLGGNISWYYASEHHEKVKKLVLIDSSGYPPEGKTPWVFKLARIPILNSIIRYFTPKLIIKNNLNQVYFDNNKIKPELIDRYYNLTLREGNRTAFIDRAKTDFKDYTTRLKQLYAPTLVIWGKEDIWIPISNGKRFAKDIPDAQLVILEGSGHIPMEESPMESLKPVVHFLRFGNHR